MVVKDSGQGIPTYLVPRLYQPFFTSKPGRQGLSLSRTKRYVELHGGQIELLKTGEDGTMSATATLREIEPATRPKPERRFTIWDSLSGHDRYTFELFARGATPSIMTVLTCSGN